MVGVRVGRWCYRCSWYWRGVLVRRAAVREERVVVVGLSICVSWHHLSVLLLSCLVAGCHRPSPGPPAPGKPRSHPRCCLTSISLCSTQAIKSPQLRVNRWKVWHFAFDWRRIQSDRLDRCIQAQIWIYFFSPCIPTLCPQPLLWILLPIPSCLILPLPEVIGPSCKRMCPVPYLILNHYLTI